MRYEEWEIAALAQERGLDLVAVGGPKTIDNDVGDSEFKLIDHTPGYGSVARYWALTVQNANQENAGSSPSDPVLVIQAMGRKIGFIPAAARLADPRREMPLQIYMFVRYARPLIGDNWPTIPLVDGRQRFARLERIFAAQKLPGYVPQAHRRG